MPPHRHYYLSRAQTEYHDICRTANGLPHAGPYVWPQVSSGVAFVCPRCSDVTDAALCVWRRYRVEILGASNGAARVSTFYVPEPHGSSFRLAVVSADHPDAWAPAGPSLWQPLVERLERPWSDSIDLLVHAGGQVSMTQALLDVMQHLKAAVGQR